VVGTGGASQPFCLSNNAPAGGWVGWDGGMMWRAVSAGANVRGQYSNGPNDFSCAVCEGNVVVMWGTNSCPASYTTLMDGYVGAMGGGWGNGWSPGGPICLHTSAGANWVNWDSTMVMRGIGSSGNNRVQYQNSTTMPCRVCY
jgi:hypothetical protein